MAQKFDDSEGVWRTIGGRRVFIRTGQSLADAMIESGKFKNLRSDYRKAKEEMQKEKEDKEWEDKVKKLEEENAKNKGYELPKDEKKLVADWENGVSTTEETLKAFGNDEEKMKEAFEKLGYNAPTKENIDATNKRQAELQAKQEAVNRSFEENQKQLREQLEKGNKPYELEQSKISDAYKTYREKRDKLEGIETDELGNRNYDNRKDATWTGKEYTTEEYLANLEDENWHTERRMILEAGLTKEQIDFVKDNTKFHNGSPNLDKEITEELIKGAKGEEYRKPSDILNERKNKEITELESELKEISQFGKYDEKGNYREGVKKDYRSYSDKKKRYEELSGKTFDDSNIKIDYDENKTYEFPNGKKIDQNLMKEWYSGENPEKVKSDIEFEKSVLYDKSPKDRERAYAQIKEMEKYYDSMEKYESRISDDFTVKDMKNGYTSNAWEGSNYDPNMSTTEISKAVVDKMKEAYPNIKLNRKSSYYSGGSSAHFNIMESDKPLIRSINDFSDSEIERLYNSGYNKNWYKTKDEFKESLRKDLESGHLNINQYNVSDDYRLTPYGKAVIKDMNKVINSYNFDDSDSQTDYFHTNFYDSISIGKSDKPYKTVESKSTPKTTNETMNDTIRDEAFRKYQKNHPNSKMTLAEFLKKKK